MSGRRSSPAPGYHQEAALNRLAPQTERTGGARGAPATANAGARSPRSPGRWRTIGQVDLGRYRRPVLPGSPGAACRAAWYVCNALLFQSALVLPSRWKAALLRRFGARVGHGLVIRPRVTIKCPWFLELGNHVWLGEAVWIDNQTTVALGSNVCVSQGAYLFTGNHDYNDPHFRFFCEPIRIEDGAWVGARAVVCPGSVLERMSVVGAGVVWSGAAEAGGVYTGRSGRDPVRLVEATQDAEPVWRGHWPVAGQSRPHGDPLPEHELVGRQRKASRSTG
jgi:putative colanic acid biosynthesis acetyltransferase WcaF